MRMKQITILFLILAHCDGSRARSIHLPLIIKQSLYHFKRDTTRFSSVTNGIKVSANKRYLVDAITGKPVFILANTLWNINSLTTPEIDTLLSSIAKHKFNAIMFTLNFSPQGEEANAYGQKAYIGEFKTDLNPAYFSFVDHIINKCSQLGVYAMIYTMWAGTKAGTMNSYTPEQLHMLGVKIGQRFKGFKNVILVAGGEASPPYIDTARVNAMGQALKEGCEGKNLVAVHPCSPHSTSEYYASSSWLDFYMSQAKSDLKGISYDLTKAVVSDYHKVPVKPTMVAEHRYESGTEEDPIIQRRSLYLSVFAGGFGYAYGHNALWQMTPHTAQPWMLSSWKPGVKNWKEAINTIAVNQLHYISTLLYAYPYLNRFPDQQLIVSVVSDSVFYKVEAMRDGDPGKNNASYIMAYISSPQDVIINTQVIKSTLLNAYWFNPRTGISEIIALQFKNTGRFEMGKKAGGQDWVIVIDTSGGASSLP
jgi:hypothetical protein